MAARSNARTDSRLPVFDAHVHIAPWDQLHAPALELIRKSQPKADEVTRYQKDPREFLRLMDRDDVERVCLINYVAPEVMGFTKQVNRWVHAYARAAPDRFVSVGGLHPADVEQPQKEVDELLSKFEVRAVKLHPPHQLFYPNDFRVGHSALSILYEACQEQRVPIIVHTGTSIFPGALNKYGDPMALDEVAVRFPKLKIILAHGGRPLWMETAWFLIRRHPNVYIDVSGIPPKSLLDYFPRLESQAEKFLFGSDWPGPQVLSIRSNADALAALPLASSTKRKILSANARKLWK